MQAARYWALQWIAEREALRERRVLSVPVAGVYDGRGFLADLHLELLSEEGPLVEHPDMALRPLGRELLDALKEGWQSTRQCVCWTLTLRDGDVPAWLPLDGDSLSGAATVGFHLLRESRPYDPDCIIIAKVGEGGLLRKVGSEIEKLEAAIRWGIRRAVVAADTHLSRADIGGFRQGRLQVVPLKTLAEAVEFVSGLGDYVRIMRDRCGRFERTFVDSPMNELTHRNYVRQPLGERVKEQVSTPRGLEERDVELQREFAEAVELHRRLAVIGRAGRGKTSLLRWAVLTWLEGLERAENELLPICIPLRELQRVGSLEAYLRAEFPQQRVFSWLWHHVQEGNILLLLDALDEAPRDRRKELVSDRGILADLVRMLAEPQTRIVLTCRDSVYAELSERLSELKRPAEKEGFVKMELKPFGRDQIIAYAGQFFGDEQKAQSFLKDIEDPRGRSSESERPSRYTHLAQEPLYLHMLCWLWAGMGQKAESR